jgi:hypothetical protein
MAIFTVRAGSQAMLVEAGAMHANTAQTLISGGEPLSLKQLLKDVDDKKISRLEAAIYAAARIAKKRYIAQYNVK